MINMIFSLNFKAIVQPVLQLSSLTDRFEMESKYMSL